MLLIKAGKLRLRCKIALPNVSKTPTFRLHFRLPRAASLSRAGFRLSAFQPFGDLRWVWYVLMNIFKTTGVKGS
jgi:hypothetical protein